MAGAGAAPARRAVLPAAVAADDRRCCAGPGARTRRLRPWSSTARWSRPPTPAPIDALIAALGKAGPQSAADLRRQPEGPASPPLPCATLFAEAPPDIDPQRDRLRRRGAGLAERRRSAGAVRLPGAAGRLRRRRAEAPGATARAASPARDIAMNVALPEIDGRIMTRAVSFKGLSARRRATEADIVAAASAVAGPHRFVAELAANWARLRRDAAGRAPHRHRARQLSQPRRPASATASASTRRRSSSTILRALARRRLSGRGHAGRRRRADARACWPARPTTSRRASRAHRRRRPHARRLLAPSSRSLPQRCSSRSLQRWGPPEGDPFFRPARSIAAPSPIAGAPLRQCRRRPAAGARLQHRPGRRAITTRTSCRRTAISPSMPGCATRSAPTRSSMSASTATSNGCRARRSRSRRDCLPEAALGPLPQPLSLHRQRSRRGHAGEAPRRRRDHRSSDAAADPRREATARSPRSSG